MAGLLTHTRLSDHELYKQYLGRGEIRLVSLRPGSWSDAIVCDLSIVSMNRRGLPPYRALSYVWGLRSRDPPSITVNGCRHRVTINLESALRCIRDESRSVDLWIDAICINQGDAAERSMQVSMMCEIYSRADDVLIFLGDDVSPHRRMTQDAAAQIRQKIKFNGSAVDDGLMEQVTSKWRTSSKRRSVQALDVFCLVHLLSRSMDRQEYLDLLSGVAPDHLTRIFEGLRSLLTLRWWLRIWVVQEAIVGKRLTVMYGNISAPWSMLVDAAAASINSSRDFLVRGGLVPADDVKVLGLFSRVLDLDQSRSNWREGEGEKESLLSLLRHFSNRDASDNRDKIFALLGLCRSGIWPDYEQNDRDTYTSTTVRILTLETSLSALGGDLGRKNQPDLPSWVPDWSWALDEYDHGRERYFDHYDACGDLDEIQVARSTPHEELEPCDRDAWRRHIKTQLQRLAEDVTREAQGARDYLPEHVRPVLSYYKQSHPDMGDVCDSLMDLCRYGGARGFWDHGTVAHVKYEPWDHSLLDLLRVSGKLIGRVMKVLEPLYSASHLALARETIKTWWEEMPQHKHAEEVDLYRFASTLLSGFKMSAADGTLVPLTTADKDDLIFWLAREVLENPRWYRRRLDAGHAPDEPTLDAFTRAMELSTARRTMFIIEDAMYITEAAMFGLGPASMAVNDHVYILPGGRLPFILRPDKEQYANELTHVYQLLGDCYVSGIMDGERAPPGWGKGTLPDDIFESAYRHLKQDFLSLGVSAYWTKRPWSSGLLVRGMTRGEVARMEDALSRWWNEESVDGHWTDEGGTRVITQDNMDQWYTILDGLRGFCSRPPYIYLV